MKKNVSYEKLLRRVYIRRALVYTILVLLTALIVLRAVFSVLDAQGRKNVPFCLSIFDVGQSDAALLQCDGQAMLIDTGVATEERSLLAELSYRGIERLDYLVLTHPHEDHIGNARVVMDRYEVGHVLVPDTESAELGYTLTLNTASERAGELYTVKRGDRFTLGTAEIEVLLAGGNHKNINNDSIVLRVTYKGLVLLFMGDAESEVEEELIATYDAAYLDCDFLKVGHHGSNTATSKELLAVTTPALAAIGCGELNEYGFPHREVTEALAEVGAAVWRTDLDGTLAFMVDQEGRLYKSED